MAEAWEVEATRQIDDEESPSARARWCVVDATDYANARATLDAVIPTNFIFPDGRVAYLDALRAESVSVEDKLYFFRAEYESQPKPTFNQQEYEFEVSAPQDQLYQSISTAGYYTAGGLPDFKGAIGVRDGEVEGRPPLQPLSTFRITKHFATAAVTEAFQLQIEAVVGKTNSVVFNGRQIGEVRLMGARGNQSGDKFPISYEFGVRRNGTPFDYNGIAITVPPKGWEIVDPYYQRDQSNGRLVNVCKAVYVHKVYEEDDFSGLDL